MGNQDKLARALAELAESTQGHRNEKIVPQGQRPCPICQEHMEVIDQHGIYIDVCEMHGAWLDLGELSALLGRLYERRREVETSPPPPHTKKQKETQNRFVQNMKRVNGILAGYR